ncbi:Hsp20/alpha crystallin family protein [Pedobacter ureilyticus]|uniref:Hsp20/alpha crystallin family protein n=1 Tax=Pedobacter ureilyticus TaxID=1393051 RepID=A0ABW9J9V9_9SPHI|nr:Hsp20/alpha crystallin family protein [Pedobacter helvus]
MTLVKFNGDQKGKRGLMPAMNNVFDSIFADGFFNEQGAKMVSAVNVLEAVDHFKIELAAPGLQKEDFKVSLDRNLLSISVEKEEKSDGEGERFTRREFSFHSFVRTFSLPETADQQAITAKYEDGLLKVKVAKKEEAKLLTRQIEIS